MQHKCVCECVSAVGAGATVGCVVDLLHDHGGLVANHFGEAKVLVGPGVMRISWPLKMDFCGKKRPCSLDGRNIENAMPKGTECDGRIANVGEICEHDLKNGNVSNDRR
jgi:hypothetical protein